MTARAKFFVNFGLAVTLALLVSMNATLIYLVAFADGPWDPLGEYPLQTVVDVTGDSVVIEGTKCNNDSNPVRVVGSISWQRLTPPGFVMQSGAGVATRAPGCLTELFTNTVPTSVMVADVNGATWRIVGSETPFKQDGTTGVQRTFESEVFELVPR